MDHEGDGDEAKVIGLDRDLTIEVDQEARDNGFIDFIKTIEIDAWKQAIDVIGLRVSEVYYTPFMNVSILNLTIETSNGGGCSRELGDFWNVVFGTGNILGDSNKKKLKINTTLK